MNVTDIARADSRARQGTGARYDAVAAPTCELLWARHGTAYFARKLNELTDADLNAPSAVPGWSRRHVIAHVGYHARAIWRLVDWGRTGVEHAMYRSDQDRITEINQGATLPARALRHLFQHSEVHLNVAWRDLRDHDWDARVRDVSGAEISLRDTVTLRAKEVWFWAVDLNSGANIRDFPTGLTALNPPED